MTAWPPAIAGSPAAAVLERAIAGRRPAHSLLLHGDDGELLEAAARTIADRLLAGGGLARARPPAEGGHPDGFDLRPAGKMRQISAEATRELIARVQLAPAVAPCKVAIVHEADRMNAAAANIFLKTLEEPPARTVLLLLTARPYALLPTIRSRCFHFRLPGRAGAGGPADAPGWPAWIEDYRAWLALLPEGGADRRAAADRIMALYGLVARFGAILAKGAEEAWNRQKASLPPDLDEEEMTAIETGIGAGLRARLLAEIAVATRDFARPLQQAGRALPAAVERLERGARLLRLNLNESAALEDFLLASLRIWSRP